MSDRSQNEDVRKEVFCTFIRKDGKILRPKKGKYFHFFIEA